MKHIREGVPGPERDFAQALCHFKKAEHEQALHCARRAARKGHAKAQYFLGLLYEHGFAHGLAHDRERKGEKHLAAYWRQKAAEAGYEKSTAPQQVFPEAELSREADSLADPDNPARDDHKAAALYRRVVDGNPEAVTENGTSCAEWAMESLLRLYEAGRGLSQGAAAWLAGKSALEGAPLRGLARLALARMFARGHGVERDEAAASRWLRAALELGGNDADRWWRAESHYELGLRYWEGRGVDQDDVQAAACFALAAEHGPWEAQCMMGHVCRLGRGVPRNTAEAVRWYRKACGSVEQFGWETGERIRAWETTTGDGEFATLLACAQGEAESNNVDAFFLLGVLYADGLLVAKNERQAAAWLKKAARAGDAQAQYLLGHFAEQGIGMAKNTKTALRWRQKAAEQDILYTENFACFGEDYDGERRRWLTRQAKKGDKFVLYELAWVTRKRPARRARLLLQAAEQDNRSAQHSLGLACCEGKGVAQDYAQAVHWLRLAVANPETPPHFENELGLAQSDLAHLYREGKGVERDPVQAVKLYEQSLDDVNCCSALALGMACEHGCGVERNRAKARDLYRRQQGNIREGAKELAAFFLELFDAPTSYMTVVVGSDIAEAAILSLSGIVYSKSLRLEGRAPDEAMDGIIQAVRKALEEVSSEPAADVRGIALECGSHLHGLAQRLREETGLAVTCGTGCAADSSAGSFLVIDKALKKENKPPAKKVLEEFEEIPIDPGEKIFTTFDPNETYFEIRDVINKIKSRISVKISQ